MQFFIYFTMSEECPMNPPSMEGMKKMGQLMEEAFNSGIIVSTGKLPSQTTHISLKEGEFSVSDGPFLEGKEMIPGYTVIEVPTKDDAIAWAKKMRECMGDGVLKMAQLDATSKEHIKK